MIRRLLAGAGVAILLAGCGPYREPVPALPPVALPVSTLPPADVQPALPLTVAPPPAIDWGCPVEVPRPEWQRAIHSIARATAPGAAKDAACEIAAIARAESAWRPDVCSHANACGLLQLIPAAAAQVGIKDRLDPIESIRGGGRYWAWQIGQWRAYNRTRDERRPLGLAGYNWGLGFVLRVQRREGCVQAPCFYPHLPAETRDYLFRVDRLRRTGQWQSSPPEGWTP